MVWSKIARVFSLGGQWGDNTIRLVEGNDASAMLKRVEGILEDSMRVLASHERLLSQGEFNTFSVKHRNLLLKVVEVKQDIYDEHTHGAPTASLAGNQSFHIDQQISLLYKQARIYHRDVISASRRAQAMEEAAFDELHNLEPKPGSSEAESTDPLTTWYSVITTSTKSQLESLAPEASSERSILTERKPYLAIAHVRAKPSGTADSEGTSDRETYREILILESNDKTMIVFNPNRRHLTKDSDPSDEDSLLEMSRAGEALLRATNPQDLQGYEAVGSQHEASWADSFVNTLSRLGVGIGADMM